MVSHYNQLTPTGTFASTDLFINVVTDISYDIPRMLHIINHHTTDVVIKILARGEDGAAYTGVVLAPEDIFDLENMAVYTIEVKYESGAGSGDIFVSGYNYFTTRLT